MIYFKKGVRGVGGDCTCIMNVRGGCWDVFSLSRAKRLVTM